VGIHIVGESYGGGGKGMWVREKVCGVWGMGDAG
jgi:hypothetical protein